MDFIATRTREKPLFSFRVARFSLTYERGGGAEGRNKFVYVWYILSLAISTPK